MRVYGSPHVAGWRVAHVQAAGAVVVLGLLLLVMAGLCCVCTCAGAPVYFEL